MTLTSSASLRTGVVKTFRCATYRMDSVTVKSANGSASLVLSNREPFDTSTEIGYFTVTLTHDHLTASARVYAYVCGGLSQLFASVAENWQTFTGPDSWSSLECEFNIEITHDGLGHFNLRVSLDSRSGDPDWELISNVVVETAQLDRIAADIRSFIGAYA